MEQIVKLLEDMNDGFEKSVDSIYCKTDPKFPMLNYFRDCLRYNVTEGKKIRGLLVLLTYKTYVDWKICDNSLYEKAVKLQGSFLILDDIMDRSPIRRGKPSWYVKQKEEGQELIAINDGVHLYTDVFLLIQNTFNAPEDRELCGELLKLFVDVAHKTSMGQGLDTMESYKRQHANPLQNFTEFVNAQIMEWKTAHYTYYLPIAAGMLLAGIRAPECFEKMHTIAMKLGEYFQTQDDYFDAFKDVEVLGKQGTDINEGKCSWLACQAVKLASPEQLELFQTNYGLDDPKAVVAIKQRYRDLKLDELYEQTAARLHSEIDKLIDGSCCSEGQVNGSSQAVIPAVIFRTQLQLLHNRKK